MKTITMYELLGMVKDGKAPKKIKVGNKIYNYETFNIGKGDNYFTAEWEEVKGYRINNDGTYYYLEIRDYNLNDEVEILEEEPRDIKVCGSLLTKSEYDEFLKDGEEKKIPEKLDYDTASDDDMLYKINEIIDYLDYLKSRGE